MDWRQQAAALARELDVSEPWHTAFAATPRHLFVPRFFGNHPERGWYAVADTDEEYLDRVYTTEALVTQLDGDAGAWEQTRRDGFYLGGHATSSSSAPQLMANMLDALAVEPGMAVLEIGTGSGYNTALLCHRLGHDQVASVEVDQDLASTAQQRLRQLGYRPTLMATDALLELPEGHYDRLMATVGIHQVPPAWLRVVRPGGLVLVNPYSDLTTDAVFALTVHDDGTASGRAPIGGNFMPTRDNTMPFGFKLYTGEAGTHTPTELSGSVLDDFEGFCLFLSLLVRDVQVYHFPTDAGLRLGLLARDGSWAYEVAGTAVHGGPRNLWAVFESAHALWREYDCPSRDRLGLTVAGSQQAVWVDAEEQVVQVEVEGVWGGVVVE